jgi:hypothetical protein
MRGMKSLFVASLIFALLLVASCSKSGTGSSSSSSSLLDNQSISYIPASSLGFVTWDTQSDGYKKLKASSFAKQIDRSYDLIKKAEGQADAETKKFFKIYDSLIQTGLWTKSADQPEAIKSGVMFVDIDAATKLPQVGFFATASDGNNLKDKLSAVQKIMNDEGIKTNPETISGNAGFSLSIEEAAKAGSPINKVYVAASADKLAITSNSPLAEKFFSAQAENGIQKIKDTNEFKQATRGITSPGDSMTFAYFDVNKLIASLESLGASTGVDAGANDLKEIPVESVAAASSMTDSLSSVVSVSLSPKNEKQKNMITSLVASGDNKTIGQVPADLMVLLSLDGGTIKSLKNAALAEAPPGAADMMKPMIELVDSLKNISVGIRGASGATPFPEILIVAQSNKASEIEKMVKSQVQAALEGNGMPIPWQEKTVADAKVSYAVSPFGIGAYLTSVNDMVIITSAEKLVSDIIATGKSSSQSLLASLPNSSQDMVKNNKSLFLVYSDFNKVGNAISAAQDSLAMFTGGQGTLPADQIENIKQMGSIFLSLNVDNNLMKIESSYAPPPNKG